MDQCREVKPCWLIKKHINTLSQFKNSCRSLYFSFFSHHFLHQKVLFPQVKFKSLLHKTNSKRTSSLDKCAYLPISLQFVCIFWWEKQAWVFGERPSCPGGGGAVRAAGGEGGRGGPSSALGLDTQPVRFCSNRFIFYNQCLKKKKRRKNASMANLNSDFNEAYF